MAETTKLCILALGTFPGNLSSKELKVSLLILWGKFLRERVPLSENRLSRGTQKGLRNHFATKEYSRRAAKLASILRFSVSNLSQISGNFKRKSTTLYKKAAKSLHNKRVISQHFAKCFLQLRVIDFMHQLDFRKCSKSGCHDCYQEYASWQILFTFSPCIPDQLLEKGFKALVLHVFELPIALPKIPKNSPQSWIALVIKLLTKTPKLTQISRGWDEPNARDMGRMKSQPNAKGEMYILNDGIDMKAKIAAMARRLEELEMKKMQEVQAISQTPLQAIPCAICLSYEHLVDECPTIPAPPQYQQPAQALPQASNLEQAMVNLSKVVGDFVGAKKSINDQLSQRIDSVESSLNKRMDGIQNDLSQKIDNIQYSISRLTNLNTVQEKGNFPS
ncbi:hypothetical protein CK203_002379 [Vitis vinifera]|uniref:Uncharacterized protein n=1 Tax=Vitis vinifera TaxID=29760 RepID=A0A438KI00_VITVI|nr:hypothetical protein CK203_002379 [Vitis vinifera]